jgi:hypothetical protein
MAKATNYILSFHFDYYDIENYQIKSSIYIENIHYYYKKIYIGFILNLNHLIKIKIKFTLKNTCSTKIHYKVFHYI